MTPQTLLFSEIMLKSRTFHFKSLNLPNILHPSYFISSNNIRINYDIEFGVNSLTQSDIIPIDFKSTIFKFPFINKSSALYILTIDEETYIMPPVTVKELFNENLKKKLVQGH